jgi:hypothetical protein
MAPWKKLLLKATGVGAGFAVTTALILATVLWWSSRPPKQKPWDDKSIVASYEGLDTESDSNKLRFIYTLENKTDADYRVENDSQVHLGPFLKQFQELSFADAETMHSDYPIYIPARSRVRFELHVNYAYPIKPDSNASEDAQHDFYTKEAQFVANEMSNVDGFTLLDEGHRYKIVMPNGWAVRAKQPMRLATANPTK